MTEQLTRDEVEAVAGHATEESERLAAAEEAIRERSKGLPWWRRPRKLRRQLALTLVGTALASVLLVGGLNFFAARDLLDEGTEEQLVGIGQSRARAIEDGVDRLLGAVAAVSADLGIVRALEDFTAEFEALDGTALTDAQEAELAELYQTALVDPVNELGLEPVALDDYLPASPEARYLQYHYNLVPDRDGTDRASVVDAGDGSGWSEVHAFHHPALSEMATQLDVGDALLVSAAGDVVYTTDKRIDLGTNLFNGPYADTELGRVVTETLPRVRAGNAVIADLQIYLPAGGQPVFFAAAAVRNDTEVVGVYAVEVPIDALNAITTAEGRWEEVGLGAGESYVVGSDRVLRSESRLWIEDPEQYLDKVDDEQLAPLIATFESPVGIQPVDTKPVQVAIDGEEFNGTARSYLGTRTFSYAQPIGVAGVEWVVVVDVPLDDARGPLRDYAGQLGLVLLVVLPSAAFAGLWLARRLTRSIPPVTKAANEIVGGERDPDIPDLGHDEFGDLARRLRRMAGELGERERALAEEYESRRELLLTVLPPRVVHERGEVAGTGELADLATAISVMVDTSGLELDSDEERQADLLDEVAEIANRASGGRAIERVRASAESYLYLAGAGTASDGVDDALAFAADLTTGLADLRSREHVDIGLRVGIATGAVATGVLDSGSLTFGAWGLPVRQAMAEAALSVRDEVLIDRSTVDRLDDPSRVRPAADVLDLDGRPMDLSTLR